MNETSKRLATTIVKPRLRIPLNAIRLPSTKLGMKKRIGRIPGPRAANIELNKPVENKASQPG